MSIASRTRTRFRVRPRADAATWALGALLLGTGLLLAYAGRHLTFFYDEWNFIFERRGGSLDTYLNPHNGHLLLFPVIVYKLGFATVGMRHYTLYRLAGIGVQLIGGALLYLLARRRIGPWLALVPTAMLMLMGSAYQDLLWPFQISYMGSIAGGLGAFALLERPERRHDGWAAALLVWSVASSGLGIAFALGCAVLMIAQRSPWQRLWVVAVPAILYLLWYVGWASGEHTSSDAILGAPQYVADAAAGTAAGLAGLDNATWGAPLAVALGAILIGSWWVRVRGGPSPMLLAALTGVLAFWVLTALVRSGLSEPAASRYLYVGAVFVLLIAAEARVGLGIDPGWLALAGVVVAGMLIANIGQLRDAERGLRRSDTSVRTSLAATELAAPVVSPAFMPDPQNAPQVTAGAYLAAVRDLGSPAFTLGELERSPEPIREHADQVLEHAERLGAGAAPRGACTSVTPTAATGSSDVQANPGSGLVVRTRGGQPARIYVRRLASAFAGAPLGSVAPGAASLVRLPVDAAPSLPWHIRVAAAGPVLLCRA